MVGRISKPAKRLRHRAPDDGAGRPGPAGHGSCDRKTLAAAAAVVIAGASAAALALAASAVERPMPAANPAIALPPPPSSERVPLPATRPHGMPHVLTAMRAAPVPTWQRNAVQVAALDGQPMIAAPVPTWQRNAVQVAALDGRPMIAVVIDDMGVDRGRSARMLRLPGPLTMAYMTYARDLPRQAGAARRMGHELLLHVPMEPEDGGEDAGPNALVAAEGAAEIGRRLDWGLRRLSGYVGISNHMGSRFTADDRAMAVVMETLQRRGLLFLDSLTTTATVAIAQARRYGVPAVSRHVFLDNERTPEAVRRALAETEAEARRRGYAVAVGHPHDVTREALADWLPRLARRGFVLVPLSAVVGRAPEMG